MKHFQKIIIPYEILIFHTLSLTLIGIAIWNGLQVNYSNTLLRKSIWQNQI